MLAPSPPTVAQLQSQVQRMQGSALTRTLTMLPALAPLIQLRTGMTCSVESVSLAMALLAGPSGAGDWTAVVGAPDFGLEAAAAYGMDLSRTIVVPDPGEHWLSVTAGLIDVTSVVVVRPPNLVPDQQAARLVARLRQKDAALLVLGEWPRCQLTVSVAGSRWVGLGQGHGYLTGRHVRVRVRSGGMAPREAGLWLPRPESLGTLVERVPDRQLVDVQTEAG